MIGKIMTDTGSRLHRTAKQSYLRAQGQIRRLSGLSRRVGPAVDFVEEELDSWSSWRSMSHQRRLWLWRHGFLSKDGLAYGLTSQNIDQYLSDYERKRAGLINGRWSFVNANKLVFHHMLERFDEHRMTVHGRTTRNRFIPVDEAASGERSATSRASESKLLAGVVALRPERTQTTEWLGKRLRTAGKLVLKPIYGGMGKGVFVCSREDGTYHIDGEPKTHAEFKSFVAELDGYLVCEYTEQAAYADELFPDASNTLRILTMWDEQEEEAFVPIAIHRIGSRRSAPVDNVSKGGITAEIDLETGELVQGAQPPYADESDYHAVHPDTGTHIEGTSVPGWTAIKDDILELAATFADLPYIGWDLIVTDEGEFTVVEANNNPGARSLQVHRPLLANPRVRRFYEHHDVI